MLRCYAKAAKLAPLINPSQRSIRVNLAMNPHSSPRCLILACSIAALSGLTLHAEPAPTESIRDSEVKQQQLQGEATGLAGQLDGMIAEYARNGLSGEDVDTVKALRDSINRLSASEMQQIVAILQKAGGLADAGQAKKQVSEAFSAQKNLLVQMKRLLAQHQRDQQAIDLASELTQLADRQSTNLQNGIELGKWAGGRKPDGFEAALQAHLEGQQTEEAAIGEELKLLAEKIAGFAKATADDPELAARFQKGLEAVQKLQPSTDGATAALKEGQLFKAVTQEKATRDAMRKLAREVAPPTDAAEALRQATRDLEKIAGEQRDLAANIAKAQAPANFEQWLETKIAENAGKGGERKFQHPIDQLRGEKKLHEEFENLQREKAGELASLDDPQGDLATKTDLAAQDMARNAPTAAAGVKAAEAKMQEARAAMAENNGAAAAKNAQDAAAALDAVRAQVEKLAGLDTGRTPDRMVNNVQRLDQAAHELAKREAAAALNPDKTAQATLSNQIQQLAQRAAIEAPAAAADLQKAADDAQKAATAAEAGQVAQATAAQLAAAQDLAKADQQLNQVVAKVQQVQQQRAVAQKAGDTIKAIILAQQALERDTAKALAQYQPKHDELFSGQGPRQEELQSRTGKFKTGLSPEFTAALSALTDATIDMGQAQDALEKPDGKPADDFEKKALADLYRVQKVLTAKAEDADAELGNPPNPQTEEAVAQMAAQAAAAAAQAMQTLKQGQAQQAAQQLLQAAVQAGTLAVQPGAQQDAAQEAADALSQAAAQAAANNLPEAQAATLQAQQDLFRAQTALTQMQAGLAQAAPEPPGAPHEGPPHAGDHPGQHSSTQGTHAAKGFQPGGDDAVQKGTRSASVKSASFAGLPPRERAAIEQSRSEKYPEEYGVAVEQYLRNLASESGGK